MLVRAVVRFAVPMEAKNAGAQRLSGPRYSVLDVHAGCLGDERDVGDDEDYHLSV